jgi:ADP-heptose:LPS heptosyltransferase
MRILVINLTRFGDLLQSQAAIQALHEHGHEVGLTCLQNFADVARCIRGLRYVAPLPGNKLLAALDRHWTEAVSELHAWLGGVFTDFAPENVLNLTSTPAARLLARRIAETGDVSGFGLDGHGFGRSDSAWTAFFEASSRKRGCSPFNIVDLFLRAAGMPAPGVCRLLRPEEGLIAAMRARLHSLHPAASAYVAFQLGASEARRQWPAEQFALLGARLRAEFDCLPILLGTREEQELARRYREAGGPGIDLTGATTLPDLAAALCQTRLLVTNDTGTMHLAAGLGIPCLALFLATAQPWDTGPYLEDCCSLEPALDCHPCPFGTDCRHDLRCTRHIAAEHVWPVLAARLHSPAPRWNCPPESAKRMRAWISERDDQGYMDLRSISGHDREERTLWIRMQRALYRRFFDMADSGASPCPPDGEKLAGYAAQLNETARTHRRRILARADALLHLFHEQGQLFLMRSTEPHGRNFLATCRRIGDLFNEQDSFNALGRVWTVMVQEKAETLPALLALGILLRNELATMRNSLC